ncbi:34197_t:CDS:2, partial [Racocetra persica]
DMNFVKVTETGLTLTYSDGNKSNHPDTNPRSDESGAIFTYRIIAKAEQKTILYATKLGSALGSALEKQGFKVPNAILTDLPEGYALFEHIKQYPPDESGKAKPIRKDTYLFGNGSKYRSPAEFEEHLLWLASNKTSSCRCRYCDKGWSTGSDLDSTSRKKNDVDPHPNKKIKSNVLQNEPLNLASSSNSKIHQSEIASKYLIQERNPKETLNLASSSNSKVHQIDIASKTSLIQEKNPKRTLNLASSSNSKVHQAGITSKTLMQERNPKGTLNLASSSNSKVHQAGIISKTLIQERNPKGTLNLASSSNSKVHQAGITSKTLIQERNPKGTLNLASSSNSKVHQTDITSKTSLIQERNPKGTLNLTSSPNSK